MFFRLSRILYSLYGIVHAMACLPPAVGAHPSGRIGLFPIVRQRSGVRDYIHVMDLAEAHRANPCGYVIDEE